MQSIVTGKYKFFYILLHLMPNLWYLWHLFCTIQNGGYYFLSQTLLLSEIFYHLFRAT